MFAQWYVVVRVSSNYSGTLANAPARGALNRPRLCVCVYKAISKRPRRHRWTQSVPSISCASVFTVFTYCLHSKLLRAGVDAKLEIHWEVVYPHNLSSRSGNDSFAVCLPERASKCSWQLFCGSSIIIRSRSLVTGSLRLSYGRKMKMFATAH